METEIQIRDVEHQYLAAVRQRTTGRQLAKTIRALLDENAVYRFFKEADIEKHGHNVFVYWDDRERATPANEYPLVLEVAVQVDEPFAGDERVVCSSTPAGQAAVLMHVGAYDQLGRTHDAIIAWCDANGLARTGMRWEVYGRWNDDPAKLQTEVFYLLE